MAWLHGGLGPMQGQANHFNVRCLLVIKRLFQLELTICQRFAPERIPYGMQRYTGETERLVGILDNHLKDKEYLVGNKYSIADINSFGWVNMLRFSGVDIDQFPHLKAWWERIVARPAVARGLSIPQGNSFGNDGYLQKLKDDKEFAEKENKLKEQIQAAKDKYGYKYASP